MGHEKFRQWPANLFVSSWGWLMAKRWTEERIRQIAPNYTSRTDLSKNVRGAYRFASKIPGLLDELYGNQKFVWTEDQLRVEASKYATRSELQACNSGCYKSAIAKFPHLLDEIYGPALVRRIDTETCLTEARLCSSRGEFADRYVGSYQYALRTGIDIDALFPKRYVYWNEEKVRAEARKYKTKSEFNRGCVSAYGFAWANGLLDDLGFEDAELGFRAGSPAYLYLADIDLVDRTGGLLFGITNNHPNYRYKKYEHQHLSNHTAFLFSTGSAARGVETAIKRQFHAYWIPHGLSPMRDKSGTNGEILRGVSQMQVIDLVVQHCGDIDQTMWGFAEA